MSDYIDKAKVASKYVLLPTVAGCYLALKKMCRDPRVNELDLAERGEMRHMVLQVPAAGKEKANETGCSPGWGDTPNFQAERTLDQDANADVESNGCNDDTSHVAVAGEDDLGSQEAMDTTPGGVWIPEVERHYTSDAMVHGTGESFNSSSLEGYPAKVEYPQIMEDLEALEMATNAQDMSQTNHQPERVITKDNNDDQKAYRIEQ